MSPSKVMDWEGIVFDSSALVAGLFLLQYGADSFIENSAIILEQIGISATLAHLVTAGAEWEELAIVVASIFEKKTPIGLGNIIGSSISNILGGLALAMLMCPGTMTFDACAKFYSGASLVASSVFLLIHYTDGMDFTGGLFYMVFFFVYIFAVGLAIYEGYLTMPVTEEDDPTNENFSAPGTIMQGQSDIEINVEPPVLLPEELQISILPSLEIRPSISTPLLGCSNSSTPVLQQPRLGLPSFSVPILSPRPTLGLSRGQTIGPIRAHTFRSLRTVCSTHHSPGTDFRTIVYHASKMILGFLALALSGFVLSYASASLAESFHISQFVFSLTILSILSTIPEKFISIIAGLGGDSSLLVASIAGSNVFLLTLCIGILLVAGGESDADIILARNILPFEAWSAWCCAVLLSIIVWVGGRRWMGALLFMLYILFNILELTTFRR